MDPQLEEPFVGLDTPVHVRSAVERASASYGSFAKLR